MTLHLRPHRTIVALSQNDKEEEEDLAVHLAAVEVVDSHPLLVVVHPTLRLRTQMEERHLLLTQRESSPSPIPFIGENH